MIARLSPRLNPSAASPQANSVAGLQTIRFNIAGGCPRRIALASALPDIVEDVVIERNFLRITSPPGGPKSPMARAFWLQGGDITVRDNIVDLQGVEAGDAPVKKTSRKSLKLLGSVGEPINPEAWEWYHRVVGDGRCPIVDTWWQTETGGILITPLPGATRLKPGSATRPFFGCQPQLVDAEGKVLEGATSGNLCIIDSWPGQMRTVFGDHQRFIDTYFKTYPGKYFTGDGCRRDEDGYYWITGRVDDVINVAGHRMGTAEVESALVAHSCVSEAAVVGYPHDIKGQGIYAYVTLNAGEPDSEDVRKDLVQWVRKEIGPIATPDVIHFAPALPKTRSGKIMRRVLKAVVEGRDPGDITTIEDEGSVEEAREAVADLRASVLGQAEIGPHSSPR